MVKIKEYQYEKDKPNNYQERIVEYNSWNKYVKDIQTFDGIKNMTYPSFPRQTQIYNLAICDNELKLEFVHKLFNIIIIHEAKLLE